MKDDQVLQLKEWFLLQRRDLPWRENASPYAVWVSEVMLQQTQVAVVIPYFMRWMERFPSVAALARAPVEDVLKVWEGLGYYARARNLHEGARYVVQHYNGELPSTDAELSKIKGLGPYTVGAILNFAFRKKATAVDGNVLRVLARYYCLDDDICKPKTVKKIQALTYALLPDQEPWIVSEALIELGATICSRTARCQECPLRATCKGFLSGKSGELPVKSAKTAATPLFRSVAVVICKGHVLVRKGEKGKIMADLFEFPYFEMDHAEESPKRQQEMATVKLGMPLKWQRTLPEVKHSFTRYRALLIPQLYEAKRLQAVNGYEWHPFGSLQQLPFSSGHRRILDEIVTGLVSNSGIFRARSLPHRVSNIYNRRCGHYRQR